MLYVHVDGVPTVAYMVHVVVVFTAFTFLVVCCVLCVFTAYVWLRFVFTLCSYGVVCSVFMYAALLVCWRCH